MVKFETGNDAQGDTTMQTVVACVFAISMLQTNPASSLWTLFLFCCWKQSNFMTLETSSQPIFGITSGRLGGWSTCIIIIRALFIRSYKWTLDSKQQWLYSSMKCFSFFPSCVKRAYVYIRIYNSKGWKLATKA